MSFDEITRLEVTSFYLPRIAHAMQEESIGPIICDCKKLAEINELIRNCLFLLLSFVTSCKVLHEVLHAAKWVLQLNMRKFAFGIIPDTTGQKF